MSVKTNLVVKDAPIPKAAQPFYDVVVGLTDKFCQAHLTWEYQMLCRRLAGVLARRRPSPLTRGQSNVWACAVVRVIGWVNFLDGDSSKKPYMKLTAIDKASGVPENTGQGKAKAIRDLLKIRQFGTNWALSSRIRDMPMTWMVQIGDFLVDARWLKREIQEELFLKGSIPFIPEIRPFMQQEDDPIAADLAAGETQISLHVSSAKNAE